MIPIIDGGHGWNTEGKRTSDGKFRENEFNDAICNKLAFGLYYLAVDYFLTASEWNDIPLRQRTGRANEFDKQKNGKTFFISIHADAFPEDPKANGITIFHSGTKKSIELATFLEAAIRRANLPIRYRGMKPANYTVLKETNMPAILVESGFFTNDGDRKHLESEAFRNAWTDCLIDFILEYVKFKKSEKDTIDWKGELM